MLYKGACLFLRAPRVASGGTRKRSASTTMLANSRPQVLVLVFLAATLGMLAFLALTSTLTFLVLAFLTLVFLGPGPASQEDSIALTGMSPAAVAAGLAAAALTTTLLLTPTTAGAGLATAAALLLTSVLLLTSTTAGAGLATAALSLLLTPTD